MTKTDLINMLKSILKQSEEVDEKISDIMSTPIEDMETLVTGKRNGLYANYNKDNLTELSDGVTSDLDSLIETLEDETIENEEE